MTVPTAAAICRLSFKLSACAMPTACPLHHLAKTRPILNCFQLLCNSSEKHDSSWQWKTLTSHVFLLAFSFAPSCIDLVLKSTPDVSALVTRPTPCLLLLFSSVLSLPSVIDSFRRLSSTLILTALKTFSSMPVNSLFRPSRNAVMSCAKHRRLHRRIHLLHFTHSILQNNAKKLQGCPREDGRDGLERLRNAPFKLHPHLVLVETAWNCQNLFWEVEPSHPSAQLGD